MKLIDQIQKFAADNRAAKRRARVKHEAILKHIMRELREAEISVDVKPTDTNCVDITAEYSLVRRYRFDLQIHEDRIYFHSKVLNCKQALVEIAKHLATHHPKFSGRPESCLLDRAFGNDR